MSYDPNQQPNPNKPPEPDQPSYGAPLQEPHETPAPERSYSSPPPPAQNPYGVPPSGPGGTPPQNPYGNQPVEPGSAPPPNPYGVPPSGPGGTPPQNPYGVPPTGPGGTPPQNPYGNQPPEGTYNPPPGQGPYGIPPAGPGSAPYGTSTGYGAPNQVYSPGVNDVSHPLPLDEALRQLPTQYKNVLTQPRPATFFVEKGKAAWNIIWIQLLVLALIEGILGFISFNSSGADMIASQFAGNPELQQQIAANVHGYSAPSLFSVIIGVIVGFFFWTGITHLLSKALGGIGTYLQYCYSYSLFYVPIAIISGLFSLIPFLGGLVGLAGWIYSIVLQIYMTMAVHRLNGNRATLAVLLPGVILFLLLCVGAFAIIALLGAAMAGPHR